MLQYTNAQRTLAGVPVVRLGSNPAAQLHAETALTNCYTGHWDKWGLKPNHRYTLTGGTGSEAENVYGLSYCYRAFGEGHPNYGNLEPYIKTAVQDWMNSPGHRRTMLDPRHTILNIGIAHDKFNEYFVQQFSSDYIEYDTRPTINPSGYLITKGSIKNATLAKHLITPYQITYDPPPQQLNRTQIAQTYALCLPMTIAIISHNLYVENTTTSAEPPHNCTNPYNIDPDRRELANTSSAASAAWQTAKNTYLRMETYMTNQLITQNLPVLIPTVSTIEDGSFQLRVRVKHLLNKHGPGIYTIRLWGYTHLRPSTPVVLSEQSIFWETNPPNDHPYYPNP